MASEGSTRDEDLQTAYAALRAARATIGELRAQIDGAQATLKGDEAQLGYTKIYAPMSGTIVTADAREGQTLNATYQTPTILRIADLSTMTIWTQVSEADVLKVRPGMAVYFTTLGASERRWTSKVRQILPAAAERGRAVERPAADAGRQRDQHRQSGALHRALRCAEPGRTTDAADERAGVLRRALGA